MKNRVIATLLSAGMVLGLAACGTASAKTNDGASDTIVTNETTVSESAATTGDAADSADLGKEDENVSKVLKGSQKAVVVGQDWGPAVTKTILKLDSKVKADSVSAEDFTVVETKESFNWMALAEGSTEDPSKHIEMEAERKVVDEAYAGDIIGLYDPGIFSIGETISAKNDKLLYEGIPTFAPEHFARCKQVDTMKRKQFVKGIEQIALEGAIQIFHDVNSGMEEIIVGVVGELQFEVLTYRLKNEYNVDVKLDILPYEYIRWIENYTDIKLSEISGTSDMKIVSDMKDRPLLLFAHDWSINMVLERNKNLKLQEFSKN